MPKRNKSIIMLSILFIVVSLVLFVAGGIMSGWDFKSWFVSRQAICIYIVSGFYLLILVYIILKDLVKKL